jgi:hypothetical protein
MTTTNTQIYTLVAEELGLISGNEALSADDQDKISRRASRIRAWLIEEGLCYWLDDVIPDAAALAYAQIVAGQCAELYGRGQNSQTPYLFGDAGFRALERHVAVRSQKEPIQAEYF